jgi:hypothetical protein
MGLFAGHEFILGKSRKRSTLKCHFFYFFYFYDFWVVGTAYALKKSFPYYHFTPKTFRGQAKKNIFFYFYFLSF